MTTTSVVNIKGKKNIWGSHLEHAPADLVYIGRKMSGTFAGGWELEKSKFANPFRVTKTMTRDEACDKYREYVKSNPELMADLESLRGKQLACWCAPQRCHGHVLKELLDNANANDK